MQDIEMIATVPQTVAGTLHQNKRYHVPEELAERLVGGGYARWVRRDEEPETATRTAPENAAERTGGPPDWPLETPPEAYLNRHGDDAPNSDLARKILGEDDQGDDNE